MHAYLLLIALVGNPFEMLEAPVSTGNPFEMMSPLSPGKTPAPVKEVLVQRGYPIRGSWWTLDGQYVNWQHLTTGEHAGHFDHQWLASLTHAQVNSLHSDDHEGRINWSYAVRPGQQPTIQSQPKTQQISQPQPKATTPKTYQTQPTVVYQTYQYCPNGNCPNSRCRRR